VVLQTILIFSAYSCGSSALAGFFDRCGAHSCPPHAWSNDERTKISFENTHLKQILETIFPLKKEETFFEQKGDMQKLIDFFPGWIQTHMQIAAGIGKKAIVIKHPLTMFVIKEIEPFLTNPRYIILKRPLEEIENSRLRRKWTPVYGKEGAAVIYEKIASTAEQLNLSTFEITYDDFRKNENARLDMINYCKLEMDDKKMQDATNWIR
jgi:hypothetical protein